MRATAANCATSAGHVTSKASATPRTPCARLAPPVSPWTRPPSRHRPQKPPRKKDPRKRRRERKRRRTKRKDQRQFLAWMSTSASSNQTCARSASTAQTPRDHTSANHGHVVLFARVVTDQPTDTASNAFLVPS